MRGFLLLVPPWLAVASPLHSPRALLSSNAAYTAQSGEPADLKQRTGKAAKPNEVRITTPYMTKYERARVLGTRALQIS